MVRKCDCNECIYAKEVFLEEFDEWWKWCRKEKSYISVGMRATCRKGVKKHEGSDN